MALTTIDLIGVDALGRRVKPGPNASKKVITYVNRTFGITVVKGEDDTCLLRTNNDLYVMERKTNGFHQHIANGHKVRVSLEGTVGTLRYW